MSDTTTAPTTDRGSTTGEPKFAHVVRPASAVTEAMIEGTPVTAICGHTWVPTRDPNRYPVCPECRRLMAEDDIEL